MSSKTIEVDYVIAGGGSAGCVIASRLSEDRGADVLLVEAGPLDKRFFITMPAGMAKLQGNPELDWMYPTQADPSAGNRSIVWNAGKALGGSSSINGMVYIRGARRDYDAWAESGCTGWAWRDVYPYFKRSEDFQGPASESHGRGGPLAVSPLRLKHPLADKFIDACASLGMPRVNDYCSGEIDGVFENLVTQKNGERWSTSRGFLGAAAGRPNLSVWHETLAQQVIIENGRAVGLRVKRGQDVIEVKARRETILAAGAIQSPALLMRSGIGPAAHLRSLNLPVLIDAPEVGRNLEEHASFPVSKFVDLTTYNAMTGPLDIATEMLKYLVFRRGLMTMCVQHAMAFARTRAGLAQPDVKLNFLPICLDMEKKAPHSRSGVSIFVNVCAPRSRGEIRLGSADAATRPIIDHRLLSDDGDVATLIAGVKLAEKIFSVPALARHVVGNNLPEVPPGSDEEWAAIIRRYCGIGFHPIGTCRMGSDERAVVDPTLRVNGMDRLRVIDASVMPSMPHANTNAPTIMIAEKGADMVKRQGA